MQAVAAELSGYAGNSAAFWTVKQFFSKFLVRSRQLDRTLLREHLPLACKGRLHFLRGYPAPLVSADGQRVVTASQGKTAPHVKSKLRNWGLLLVLVVVLVLGNP